jgi:transposase
MEVMEKARSWREGEEAGVAGGSEGARRATGEPPATPSRPRRIDPEVEPKAQRRTFSTAYKLQLLEQADGCKGKGELGALLRREGLYWSHLSKWRQQRATGELGKKRGRPADPDGELKRQLQQMQRQNQQLQRKLRQAEIIIEVQKKASEILGITLAEPNESD